MSLTIKDYALAGMSGLPLMAAVDLILGGLGPFSINRLCVANITLAATYVILSIVHYRLFCRNSK